jgi:hypothetical protein
MSLFTDKSIELNSADNTESKIEGDSNRTTLGNVLFAWRALWNNVVRAEITAEAGADTTNKDDAELSFKVSEGGVLAEAWRILQGGNLKPSLGKGLDFSAKTPGAGMTSQLFDNYEEGAWTPIVTSDGNNITTHPTPGVYNDQDGTYTKIGDIIVAPFYVSFDIGVTGGGITSWRIEGLPFVTSAVGPTFIAVSFDVIRVGRAGFSPYGRIGPNDTKILLLMTPHSTSVQGNLVESDMAATGNNIIYRGTAVYKTT